MERRAPALNSAAVLGVTTEQRQNAVNYRDLIAGRMTPTQIVETQRLALEWDEAHPR